MFARIKHKKQKYGLIFGLVVAVTAAVSLLNPFFWQTRATTDLSQFAVDFDSIVESTNSKYMYLSDVDPVLAEVGWGSFLKDEDSNGNSISMYYDGALKTFEKGLWAHATSNLYYDLNAIGATERNFGELLAYVGITSSSGGGNGVIFHVYGSNVDCGETATAQCLTGVDDWTLLYNEENKVAMPRESAEFIRLNIDGYRYIRLEADKNGDNGRDHSAWGDVKLATTDYEPYLVPSVAEMDAEITALGELNLDNAEHRLKVLRRDLVKNAGQYEMTQIIQDSPEMRETLEWLYNNVDILQMYTTGGKPTGTYYKSLAALTELYQELKDNDLRDETALVTTFGKRKDMYLKMVMALSLTHSKEVRFWIRDQGEMAGNSASPNISHPIDRYQVYKRMYLAGKLANQVFEQLEVEEMRYVMHTELGDDEIEWLHDWLPTVGKGLYAYPPVPYISIGNHYWYEQNYDPTYRDANGMTWEERYHLRGDAYNGSGDKTISGNYMIGFEARAPHLWMINYYGGVCWQISNFGQNMTASYGVPSTTFGQPGHLAFANYELGSNNLPAWALTNDVSGWTQSNYTGYTNINTYHPVRQMNNWGDATGGYSLLRNRYEHQGSYVTMAQAAINDFAHYEKSQLLVSAAEAYGDDLVRQEELYNQALEAQDFNFDAWYGLLANYSQQNKSAAEWYGLAAKMADSRLKNFALPFHDLLQTIITYIPNDNPETVGYSLRAEMLLADTLDWAAKSDYDEINIPNIFRQANVTRTMANGLLGRLNNQVAVFSFDGEDAGKIKLGAKYASSSAAFEYSLDGGQSWHGDNDGSTWVTEREVQLSAEQVASITAENDILVHIQGVPREGNIYTIDIMEGTLPSNLYANDKENRIVGVNEMMEWCVVTETDSCSDHNSNWVSYREASPLRVGQVTVRVRTGATSIFLPSQPSPEYHFTPNTDPDTRKYIPVSHLSVVNVSSQATNHAGNAVYAIDGNFHTRWHSDWGGNDANQWIVIGFDHTVELSAFEHVPAGGGNGRILQGDIYISDQDELDAESFRKVGQILNDCATADEGVLCVPSSEWPNRDDSTVDNLNPRVFNFRRTEQRPVVDTEGNPVLDSDGNPQTEEVVTHQAITAKYIAIDASQTSNQGKFIAARMFNFYEDRTQDPRPTAGVAYSTIEPTNGDVIARLVSTTDEELEVVTVDENNIDHVTGEGSAEHIFTENGKYTFYFRRKATGDPEVDNARRVGKAIAKVDWIMKEAPAPSKVEYICVDDTLGGGSQGSDCSEANGKTNRSISVRLTFPEKAGVKILNNGYQGGEDGDDSTSTDQDSLNPFSYLFMRNGSFTFEYVDAAGNHGTYTVTVSWIDKAAPKTEIYYSTTNPTDGEVVATLVKVERPDRVLRTDFADGDSLYDENGYEYGEDFIVTNNNGSAEYHFTENGTFTFEYRDEAGNLGVMVATVDWIREKKPDGGDKPDNPTTPDNPDDNNPSEENPGNPSGGNGTNQNPDSGNYQPGQNSPVPNPPLGDSAVIGDTGSNNSGNTGSTTSGIKIDAVGLPEGAKVASKKLTLSSALRAKFDASSELYELNFVDENGKELTETPERVVMELPAGKKLTAIYIVKDDGTTEKVEYEQVDEKHIAIKNPTTGKYLFDYEEPKQTDIPETKPGQEEEGEPLKRWYEGPLPWIGLGVAGVVIIGGIGFSAIRNRRR